MIKFFCSFRLVFCNIFTPEQAIKPYNTMAAPANTQDGIDAINAWMGPTKPKAARITAAKPVTQVEATLLKPTQATPSP